MSEAMYLSEVSCNIVSLVHLRDFFDMRYEFDIKLVHRAHWIPSKFGWSWLDSVTRGQCAGNRRTMDGY